MVVEVDVLHSFLSLEKYRKILFYINKKKLKEKGILLCLFS
jgi:hypothetical protein